MTTYFVSNAGSNTAPYDTEAKAANSISTIAALPWAATDIVKVSSTHVEDAQFTLTFPTTPGLKILSVLFNGSGTGALTVGAQIKGGSGNNASSLGSGFPYGYGIDWRGSTANNSACDLTITAGTTAGGHKWDTCTFQTASANTGAQVIIGAGAASTNDDILYEFENCTFGTASNRSIQIQYGKVRWRGCQLSGVAVTTVFTFQAGHVIDLEIEASDLSGISWTNLCNAAVATPGHFHISASELASSFAFTTGTIPGPGGMEFTLANCSDGDQHYRYEKRSWSGSISAVNTHYADATDGTNSFSLAMTSNANASFTWPLIAPAIRFFNASLTAMTTTVPVAHNAVGGGTGGKLLNSDAWQETGAKVTSGSPLATWNVDDRVANILAAGADQDTDGTTSWTGSSIGTHDKLVSGSFTPAEVGEISTVVKLAKPSVTIYVSPKVLPGSSKQWMNADGVYVNEQPARPTILVNSPALVAA